MFGWFKKKPHQPKLVRCYLCAFEPNATITSFELAQLIAAFGGIGRTVAIPQNDWDHAKDELGDTMRHLQVIDIEDINPERLQ